MNRGYVYLYPAVYCEAAAFDFIVVSADNSYGRTSGLETLLQANSGE